jgi:hypothetical protein
MLWHILTFMGIILMSSGTPAGDHPAEGITPAEPIEFIFKDALLPEYYNQEEQEYELDFDELRQRGLVWKHSDIHPNDFGYIESYLRKTAWHTRNPIYLDTIDDNDMFLRLKELWKQETSDGLPDIDADRFFSFLYAANFLGIRKDARKRFARNMVKKGLLSTHSQDILRDMDPELKSIEMSWELLLAFAAELECEVQESDETVILCSTGSGYGKILKAKPKTTMKELRILPDVFGGNKNVGTHMTHHLLWFLWHLNLHELDLSGCKMDENDVDALSKAGDVGLQAMNVSQCGMPSGSLAIILPHLNDLTKLHASWNSLNEADCDALAASTLLTELNVGGGFEDSGYLAIIVPHLKYLTKLNASFNNLNGADCDALAASTLLTELNVGGGFEDSGYLAIILPRLNDLNKLYASYNSLNGADCDALAASTLLTELDVEGCFGNSPGYLARILPYLNDLTKLHAAWNSLNDADREAIETARERGIKVIA